MFKRLLVPSLLLMLSAVPLFAAGNASDCDELKKSIGRSELGIKQAEDMMKADPKSDTPDMRSAIDEMKKAMEEKKAKLKALGCGGSKAADFIDLTKGETFSTPCEKISAEIKATNAYIAQLDGVIANPPQGVSAASLELDKDSKAQALKHLKYQKALQAKKCH